jgi:hypothetical protein
MFFIRSGGAASLMMTACVPAERVVERDAEVPQMSAM